MYNAYYYLFNKYSNGIWNTMKEAIIDLGAPPRSTEIRIDFYQKQYDIPNWHIALDENQEPIESLRTVTIGYTLWEDWNEFISYL